MSYKFHELLEIVGIKIPSGLPNPLIENLASDSRLINKNTLFLGLPGQKVDGGSFWPQAKKAGAVACVISKAAFDFNSPTIKDAVIFLPDPIEKWIGELASAFWNYPSSKINLIGVTGTNGKTTITHLIEYLSNSLGKPSALFGTLVNRWPLHSEIAIHTTEFATSLQFKLAKVSKSNVQFAAMEVSSHSLAQNRIAGCRFSGAVFSNLTQDHLDYHHSIEEYFETKALLFKEPFLAVDNRPNSIVNIDNLWGRKLAKKLGNDCWKSSLNPKVAERFKAELYVTDLVMNTDGAKGVFHSPVGSGHFKSPLIGEFNVMNVLQSVGVLLQHGLPLKALLGAIPDFPGVNGRMDRVSVDNIKNSSTHPTVLVDYAHTPDALLKVLTSLRPFCSGSLICVFGCGGDRDRSKRSQMGRISSQYADKLVITSDNPRTEDPCRIIKDILSGTNTTEEIYVENNRSNAIKMAINMANRSDVVLIAGKGHEDYQIFGEEKVYFDDKKEVVKALMMKPNP